MVIRWRSAWNLALIASLAGLSGSRSDLQAEDSPPPNILFVFADDWGRIAGAYAQSDGPGSLSDLAITPHFDQLAQRGVLFQQAFVSSPSCTPCRSALLSGQHFYRTRRGAILRGAVWDNTIPAWPLLLRQEARYHIGKTFKVWSPGTPADAPFGQQQFAFQSAGNRFNQFSKQAMAAMAAGQTRDTAKQALLDEVRANFTTFLDAKADRQPFCYWFGPTNTHRTWERGSGLALWDIQPDSLQGKLPPYWPDVPEIREDVSDYLGEIAAVDAGLGILLDELQRRDQLNNTLVIVSGDHGPPGFPHGKCNLYDMGTRVPLVIAGPGVQGGRVVDDLVSLTDIAPTLLEAARIAVPPEMTGRSLWPVLSSHQQGQVDPSRTFVITGRERHVESARANFLPYPQRCYRTAEFSFIINFHPERYPLGDPVGLRPGEAEPSFEQLRDVTFTTLADDDAGPTKAWLVTHRHDPAVTPWYERAYGLRPREELYDLRSDPHQLRNVAENPAYVDTVSRLRTALLAELQRTGDPRVINQGEYFETPPLAGPLPPDVPPRRKR
jgi:N-sulfoglucosamine sulfohydrolase